MEDGLIDVLIEGANAAPSPHSLILLFEIKGAIRRLDRDEAAFDHRNVGHEMSIIANWTDPAADEANIAWTRRTWEAAQPFVSGGVYVNHMTGDEGRQRLIAAYGAGKYDRLAAIKKKYDPTNFFRMNQNIAPASL